MEFVLKPRQRIKAFFKEGKPSLILKLNFPYIEGENEKSALRFNAFYEAVIFEYISSAERFSANIEKPERPISFSVECEQKSSPDSFVSIVRRHKIRFPDGKILCGEDADVFDLKTGFLIKEKLLKRIVKKRKKAEGS